MKLMIASDIHGSAKYLSILINKFLEDNYDKLIILGDLYYHGPRNNLPEEYDCKKCIEMLNSLADKIIVVQGNCDAEVDQMVSKFPINKSTTLLIDGLSMFLTHGHIYGPQNIPENVGDVLLFGHYHVTYKDEKDGVLLLSPGSISLPKENTKHAYISYESRTFQIKDLLTDEIIDLITK